MSRKNTPRKRFRAAQLKTRAVPGDRVYLDGVSDSSKPDKYKVISDLGRCYLLEKPDKSEMEWPGSVTKKLSSKRVSAMKKGRERDKIHKALERGGGYTIVLDDREYKTLAWLADHGYDAGIYDGSVRTTDDDDMTTLRIPEYKAWEIRDAVEEDPHAFLASNGSRSLSEKLYEFLENIV